MFGLSVALSTPFSQGGAIDSKLAVLHSKRVLQNGANSITLFGTTGEGTSLSQTEKLKILRTLIKEDILARQIIVAVMTSSLQDVVSQCIEYHELGVRRVLLAPPFFFKDLSFEGLLKWYSAVFVALRPLEIQFILYNIPQLTMVPIEPKLISALQDKFGSEMVFGVKDSTGNLSGTLEFLKNKDLMVAVGDERTLADAMCHGASGAICGMSNIFPNELAEIINTKTHNPMINKMTNLIVKAPVTAGVKALLAIKLNENKWLNVRSPLNPSSEAHQLLLKNAL
jgi:4-hydroxy-tetrahydrodipicolinate synthase|tara:strand:- start:715 stop:1563 length:849 start_codon:yes stop_codon:yes gene_type:complete